jgi:uncharacterized protein YkwD
MRYRLMLARRPLRASTVAAAVLLAGGCTGSFPVPPPPPAPRPPAEEAPPGTPAAVAELVRLANAHRREVGCAALRWDARVAGVARAHSDDMRSRGFYAHTDPDGRTPVMRLDAAGIAWRATAENLARTRFGASHVLVLWLQSPTHRASLENCRLTHHGVGLSGDLWTHVFLTPR